MSGKRRECRNYLRRIFSKINAPMANNNDACRTLSNIILKAFVLDNSEREGVGMFKAKGEID